MYMDSPHGYAILGFAREFAKLNLLEFQQNVQNLYINSTNAHPCTQRKSFSLGHELTWQDTLTTEWSQCGMVQAASRPEFCDSVNLGLRAAWGRCAHPVARGEPALGFDSERRVVSVGQCWHSAQCLDERTGFDLFLRPTFVGCVNRLKFVKIQSH